MSYQPSRDTINIPRTVWFILPTEKCAHEMLRMASFVTNQHSGSFAASVAKGKLLNLSMKLLLSVISHDFSRMSGGGFTLKILLHS